MLFNSIEFLFVFFPLSYGLFLLAGRSQDNRAPVAVLLLISLVFYGVWRPHNVPLLLGSILFNYLVGRAIQTFVERERRDHARLALAIGIFANIGLIAYYKYFNFLVGSVAGLFGFSSFNAAVELPLGISFFTFTQIAFLVDVWRRKTTEQGLLHYGLFVTFYPHLVAGPILHQSEMGPQFRSSRFGRPSIGEITAGIAMFAIGLGKKVLIADPIASYVAPVFSAASAGAAITFWEGWAGTLAYTVQIYFDFSGYSDMAIGLGLMLGVRLPLNFDSPYKASSIIDFWRRWHMSLSAFLRDYLYIPLGGNRQGVSGHYANVMITMFLGGLWHGASWTFVLWGVLHGLAICANHGWRSRVEPFSSLPGWVRLGGARALTFVIVALLWVLFRAETFAGAGNMYQAMFGLNGVALPDRLAGLFGIQSAPLFGNGWLAKGDFWPITMLGIVSDTTLAGLGAILACIVVSMTAKNSQQWVGYSYSARLEAAGHHEQAISYPSGALWRRPAFAGATLAVVFWLSVLSLRRPSEFLYFNF